MRLPRALVARVVHVFLALAIVCGTFQAGARYFYCEAVGLSASDPCVARAHAGNVCPLPAMDRQSIDCCSVITLPSMPRGASVDEHKVLPAGLIAILPACEYARPLARTTTDGFPRAVQRWERPPRPGGDLRMQLMVFLT